MKKIIALLLALLMLFSLVACGAKEEVPAAKEEEAKTEAPKEEAPAEEKEEAPAEESKEEETFKVGLAMPGMNGTKSDSYAKILKAWEEYPNVEVLETNANNNALTQVSDIENLVAMGCDLIMLSSVDNTTVAPALNAAREKGIKVVMFDGYCLDANGNPAYDIFFGSDDHAVGVFIGETLVDYVGEEANYVMYEGPAGSSCFLDRMDGLAEVFENYPGWKLLGSQTGIPGRASDMTIMENWIQTYGDEIDVVVSFTDENILGAIMALEASDIEDWEGNIVLLSATAQMETLAYVMDGILTFDIATSSSVIPMVPLCYAMLTGEVSEGDYPLNYCTPPIVVSPELAEQAYNPDWYRLDDYDHEVNPLILGGLEKYAAEGYEFFAEDNYENIFIN